MLEDENASGKVPVKSDSVKKAQNKIRGIFAGTGIFHAIYFGEFGLR
jgi:hypothetical protein